jgi:hypothetical protein
VAARFSRFLLVGQRWDVDIDVELDVDDERGVERVRDEWLPRATLHNPAGIDYFVYRRGLWRNIPPFALGRTAWDNWLIYDARCSHTRVVDGTAGITILHQNHDYSHHAQGTDGVWKGPEAQRNFELAGGPDHLFILADATDELTASLDIRPRLGRKYLRRHLHTLPILYPGLRPLAAVARVPWRLFLLGDRVLAAIRAKDSE